MSIQERAWRAARAAHASIDQRRKYTGQPYIDHPVRVARTVDQYSGVPESVAAAYLHDVVEDTPVDIITIYDVFGDQVGELVEALTDTTILEDGNRQTRCAINNRRLWSAPPEAQTIKCADILDNCRDIARFDPDFARVYLPEKLECLEGLAEANGKLRNRVIQQVTKWRAEL